MTKENMEQLLVKLYKNAKTIQEICDVAINRADRQGRYIASEQVAEVIKMIKEDIQKGISDKIPIKLQIDVET